MANMREIYPDKNSDNVEKKLFKIRERVYEMFHISEISQREISRRLGVCRNFVRKWVNQLIPDFREDGRGWRKGKPRKWDKKTVERVKLLHGIARGQGYYDGATAIVQLWRERYKERPPSLRSVGRIMRQTGLSGKRKAKRVKGASRYLCYPEYSVFNRIGSRVLEMDFIGKKFISGRTAPVNFIGFSFKYSPRLRYFQRVEAESGAVITGCLKSFFEQFEKPDAVKMDNGLAMAGSGPWPGIITHAALWMLQQRIIPVYAVPRKPFTQASIEGNNSVFSKKFWNRFHFANLRQIDKKLSEFNAASQRYLEYKKPENSKPDKRFRPQIYYLRQAKELNKKQSYVEAANTVIRLPLRYCNYFLLIRWNLRNEKATVYIEKEEKLCKVKEVKLPLNEKTKIKLKQMKIL